MRIRMLRSWVIATHGIRNGVHISPAVGNMLRMGEGLMLLLHGSGRGGGKHGSRRHVGRRR